MRIAASLLLTLFLVSCASTGDPAPAPLNPESDEFQIRATILAVYNVISGPAGRRDWDRFEALFAPGAQLMTAGAGDAPHAETPKDYGVRMKPQFEAKGTFERPVATRVTQYGDIAHAWSTFEVRDASNQEQASGRGVRSVELVKIGTEWKVQSIVTRREDASHPIPAEFLTAR